LKNKAAEAGLLSKERIIAGPGFNRWLVPPAALAIHLCIGMAYGFSVFWLPLSRAIGIKESVSAPLGSSFMDSVFTRSSDWKISMLGWIYTLFFVLLGSSTALWGGWVERSGPRKAGVASAICWCGGLVIAAFGVYVHQLWLLWVGAGVIGGIGLGLGYISPVSTLIKWFPDRRGMATGMAIMGFGGGAMIGAPLADKLIKFYATTTSVGVWQTLLSLAGIYFVFMMCGAFAYRIPPIGWKPSGWTQPRGSRSGMITERHLHLQNVWKTPQFWLVWLMLCLNVSAGIGVIGMASPMLQEMFGGKLIGSTGAFSSLSPGQKSQVAAVAAGFTGLLSLFNIMGRFAWASLSDYIGRKGTYMVFFALGVLLYASAPSTGHAGNVALFVLVFCVILSMYGGGFSTVPAYLADLFGTQMVSAIHGRLLTAWATAGVLGPVLVNYLREYELKRGVPPARVYDITMYILAVMLCLGFICNLLIGPVAKKYFMTDSELEEERRRSHELPKLEPGGLTKDAPEANSVGEKSGLGLAFASWLGVGIPLAWGFWTVLIKTRVLFQ
jgi:MFS family permease